MKKSTIITNASNELVKVTLDYNELTGELTTNYEAVTGKEAARISFETSNNGKINFQVLFDENNQLQAWEITKRVKQVPFWHNFLDKGKAQFGKAFDALKADYHIDLTAYLTIEAIDPDSPIVKAAFDNLKTKYEGKIISLCSVFDEKLKANKTRSVFVSRCLSCFPELA